jgi:hypothetical protein
MATFYWRGRTTGGLYQFDQAHIPPALLDAGGNQTSAEYDGELCVVANADGSVLNPQAMGVPSGETDIYASYVNFNTWSENIP